MSSALPLVLTITPRSVPQDAVALRNRRQALEADESALVGYVAAQLLIEGESLGVTGVSVECDQIQMISVDGIRIRLVDSEGYEHDGLASQTLLYSGFFELPRVQELVNALRTAQPQNAWRCAGRVPRIMANGREWGSYDHFGLPVPPQRPSARP